MTRAEIEDQLKDYNIMVHGIRDLKPGQTHKLTWQDALSNQCSMYFDTVDSAEDLVRQIKWQHQVKNYIKGTKDAYNGD